MNDALYWGGDTIAGRRAAQELARLADEPVMYGMSAQPQYFDVCTGAQWRAAHGDVAAVGAAVKRLRGATISGVTADSAAKFSRVVALCAAVLEASRATTLGVSDARGKLALADSLARASIWEMCCGGPVSGANLLLADLWEKQGDVPRALQAVRRRSGRFLQKSRSSLHARA